MNNPLLSFAQLPDFSNIKAEHFLPALESLTQQNETLVDDLLKTAATQDWHGLLYPLETLNDRLEQMWSSISHLNGVANTKEIRDAYAQCLPVLTEYNARMGQHQGLYDAFLALKKNKESYITVYSEYHKERAYPGSWVCLSNVGKLYILPEEQFHVSYTKI